MKLGTGPVHMCLLLAVCTIFACGCEPEAISSTSTSDYPTTSTTVRVVTSSTSLAGEQPHSQEADDAGPRLFPVGGGYIDRAGDLVIEYQYLLAHEFSDSLAAVIPYGEWGWGYIDESGDLVIEPQFYDAGPFNEGLAAVSTGRGWGYIDKKGDLVIGPYGDWLFAGDFSEGLAPVEEEHGVAYIDATGEVVFRIPLADYGFSFSEGLAVVACPSCGYVDSSGEFIIEPQYVSATDFSDGLAVVEHPFGEYQIIDREGNVVRELDFFDVDGFSEGRAAVELVGEALWAAGGDPDADYGWGFIDETGTLVIPPLFKSVADFSGGLAHVTEQNGIVTAYIDRHGNYVWEPEWAVGRPR